jgi:hypothetical protein
LSSDAVPRAGEQIGPKDEDDVWTLKRREFQKGSSELEDNLIATTLRIAKERFEQREFGESFEEFQAVEETKGQVGGDLGDAAPEDADSAPANMDQDVGQEIYELLQTGSAESLIVDSKASQVSGQEEQTTEDLPDEVPIVKEDLAPPLNEPFTIGQPIVSADDERSRTLLRPTIRHTLSRLDDLLVALHNARQTCLYYGSERTESQTDVETGYESSDDRESGRPSPSVGPNLPLQPSSRKGSGRGRPRKVAAASDVAELPSLESADIQKSRGRKRMVHIPLEGETQNEMLVRIARLQKKSIPFSSAAPSPHQSSSPRKASRSNSRKGSRSASRRRGTSVQAREKRSTRLGLRDWSEVLGAAALVGYSPEVIARAAQRCASLFGEGMVMQSLVEGPGAGGSGDKTSYYMPEQIPAMDSSDDNSSYLQPRERRKHSRGRYSRKKGIADPGLGLDGSRDNQSGSEMYMEKVIFRCPYRGCSRSERGFNQRHRLVRHLKDVHKTKDSELEDRLGGSDEEMDGAVHVDGFLKHVKRRKGWRAGDTDQRRKRSKSHARAEEVMAETAEDIFRADSEVNLKDESELGD